MLAALVAAICFYACSVVRTYRAADRAPLSSVLSGGWLELPASPGDGLVVTHWAVLDGDTVRNYTACYDTAARISRWVAYPLHPAYTGGHERRDRWRVDPAIERSWQVDISRRGYGAGFDRGHQLPSGDRTANRELNDQTFYSSNATAQRSSFNRGVWNTLEGRVREMMSTDTMYVVTGAVTADELRLCENGSAIPESYYKVVLYMREGQWRAIGFWLDHDGDYGDGLGLANVLTVREVERLTGLDFFANLPRDEQDRIEMLIYPGDWGFR